MRKAHPISKRLELIIKITKYKVYTFKIARESKLRPGKIHIHSFYNSTVNLECAREHARH